ncbi:MAG: FHA domain-containing protein, partial [Planctomycetota bacterium]|nr:FHA domain-containing protein [Planctomycetota bacterium]
MLVLHVLQGPDRGMRFDLPADEPQLIGRSSESLPLTDSTVSRRHAELTPDDGKWFLRDLDSSNGTFVNGARITKDRVELSPG